jgi:hypothetical protein
MRWRFSSGSASSNLWRMRWRPPGSPAPSVRWRPANTKVTNAGLDQVSTLPKLSRIYAWGTAVTAAAVDKVKAACKDLTVDLGLTTKDVPIETKVVTPVN